MDKRYWDLHFRVCYVKFYNPEAVEVDEWFRTSVPLPHDMAAITYGISHMVRRLSHDNMIEYMYLVHVTPNDQVAHITLGEKGEGISAQEARSDYEFHSGPTIKIPIDTR